MLKSASGDITYTSLSLRRNAFLRGKTMRNLPNLEVVLHLPTGPVKFDNVPWSNARVEQGGYILEAKKGRVLALSIRRADGTEFDLDYVTYRFSQVLRNFSKIIVPDCGRFYPTLKHGLSSWENAAGFGVTVNNWGNPFVAFVDQADRCALAVGIVGAPLETHFRNEMPGQAEKRDTLVVYKHLLTFRFDRPAYGVRAGKITRWDDAVFAAVNVPSWFHALRAYGEASKRYLKLGPYPKTSAALDPVWCSWTAWNSDDLTSDLILTNARHARELGIRGMLIDDGWFGPGLDTDLDWVANGDYEPDPKKIPDMTKLVADLRAMDMCAILWMGPVTVSPDSKAFKKTRHLLQHVDGVPHVHKANKMHVLCAANPDARKYIIAMMVDLLKRFDVDGFKVDLYNNMSPHACDGPHEHDCRSNIEGLDRLMKDMWAAIRAVKPDVLMELKQNYGNIRAAQYGTMVRAGDSPYDTDINLERALYVAAYAPVTHNDYAVWTAKESPRDLGIMLTKQMIGGVPTFSVNLADMPRLHKDILKGWLDLYHEWKTLWMGNRLTPQTGICDVWERADRNRAWYALIYGAPEVTIAPKKSIWLCNGTGRDSLYVRAKKPFTAKVSLFDSRHRLVKKGRMRFRTLTTLAIPSGGYCLMSTQ